jgi:hypothetical protein
VISPSTSRPDGAGAAAWEGLVAAALIGTARRPPPRSALLAGLGLDPDELTAEPSNWRSSPRDDRGEERPLD